MKRNKKIIFEERADEGARTFKNNICGTIRTIDSGGDKRVAEIRQIGNITPNPKRENPQTYRVYDKEGLSPTLSCMEGGNLQPMIVDETEVIKPVLVMDYRYDEGCRVRKDGNNPALNASKTGSTSPSGQTLLVEPTIVASRGRNPDNPSDRTAGSPTEQRLEPNSEGICNCITTVQKDNWVLEPSERFFKQALETLENNDCKCGDTINAYNKTVNRSGVSPTITTRPEGFKTAILPVVKQGSTVKIKQATKEGYIECKLGGVADLSYSTSKTRRGRVQDNGDISLTITATETGVHKIESPYRIRKLTPRECARLMKFSDKDADKMLEVNSNSQVYKQCGNSIVVSVLEAIFLQMNIKGCPTWDEYAKDEY